MNGRAFLDSARRLMTGGTEADWRTAAGRSYYALLLEGRDALHSWGFVLKPRDPLHAFVRLRFAGPAHPELRKIGRILDGLVRLRNEADYRIDFPGKFVSPGYSDAAIQDSGDAIALLDQIAADATRRTAAVAAISAVFPP